MLKHDLLANAGQLQQDRELAVGHLADGRDDAGRWEISFNFDVRFSAP